MKYTKKEFLSLPANRKINLATSISNMGTFGFADTFGTRYKLKSVDALVAQLEKVTGYSFGEVTFEDPYFIIGETEEETVAEDTSLVEEMKDVIEASVQDVQEVLEESEAIIPEEDENLSEVVSVDEGDTVEASDVETASIDWLWINNLSNSKEDRLLFDTYAEDKFNIKLKRTMRIENMIKAFKEQI